MTLRIRKAAAAALTVACLGALAAPAFASGPGPSGGDATTAPSGAPVPPPPPSPPSTEKAGDGSTTRAPEAPKPSDAPKPAGQTPPTTAARPPKKVTAAIEEMVKVVKAAKIADALRASLLGRLAEAKAAAVAGTPLDAATMQALINDVRAAVGAAKGGDDHNAKPPTSDHTSDHTGDGTAPEQSGEDHAPGKDGVLRLLDSATAKVSASTLPDADKQALLEKIAALRAKVDAGSALGHEELGQLIAAVRAAVGSSGAHGDKHEGEHPEDAGKKPGEKALAEIDRQIAKVQASNLPEDVKAKILASLNDAKAKIAVGAATSDTDGGAAARQAIEDHRKEKLDALGARLTAAADKIDAKLTELSADPANADLVAAGQAKLAQARDLLTLSATPDDLRAAWKLLREIRHSFPHPAEPTTVASPAPTDPSAVASTEVTTTAP